MWEVKLKISSGFHFEYSSDRDNFGRPRRQWEDNIIMDLKEIDVNARNWIDSAQDKNYWRILVNIALNLQIP